jgi:hypothetical protein
MMQSMSKSKKEEKTVLPKALTLPKLMTTCVWCMMFDDVLILLLLCINNHNWDKEHARNVDGMDEPLV